MKKLLKKIVTFTLFFAIVLGYNSSNLVFAKNIVITVQPKDFIGKVGEQFSASVTAEGTGLSYQWQYSKDGGKSWRNSGVASAKTATYSFKIASGDLGINYRCVVRDSSGSSVISESRKLSTGLRITVQPKDFAGKSWKNSGVASAKTATYSFKIASGDLGINYRCVVRDSSGSSVISESRKLSTGLRITVQPKDFAGKVGEQFSASVTAEGTGLSYQWQYSKDGGKSWRNSGVASAKTATYSFKIASGDLGINYRCVVRDSSGSSVISESRKLSTGLRITVQPKDFAGKVGEQFSASVTAEGTGLSYQWQYSKDGGKSWRNSGVASAKTATYSFKIASGDLGINYRCVVRDSFNNTIITNIGSLKEMKNEDWELPIM